MTVSRLPEMSTEIARPPLSDVLACPRDKGGLHVEGDSLVCQQGHQYAVIEGIPILLVSEAEQTHIEGKRALAVAEIRDASLLPQIAVEQGEIDPFVRNAIGATNGILYKHLVGTLTEYPIPRLRLPQGNGRLFLEIGCNWGRWCIAAARLGYRPIGIDPSLKGIRARSVSLGNWALTRPTSWRMAVFCHSQIRASSRFFPIVCCSIYQKRTRGPPLRKFSAYCVWVHMRKSKCQTCTACDASIIRCGVDSARGAISRSVTGDRHNCCPPSLKELGHQS